MLYRERPEHKELGTYSNDMQYHIIPTYSTYIHALKSCFYFIFSMLQI